MVTSAATVDPGQRQRSSRSVLARAVPRTAERLLVPLVVVGVPLLVFAPALANGFVWDDYYNFLSNRDYRGLAWSHLTWMLTSAHLAHWIPVTWITLGLDSVLWGMSPAGYRFSNVVLHAANAWVFYLVARRLLRVAAPETQDTALLAGAAAAALFFSVHPLRAESVAWITERRDLVSGLFFLLSVFAYLRGRDATARPGRWLAMSVVWFQFGVLSKSIVVTLPVVLLVLDVYPLRRLEPSVFRWIAPANRRVLLEKLPYLPMTFLGSFVAISTFGRDGILTPLDRLPLLERVAAMAYGASFYVWKTALPFSLSPLYELPQTIEPLAPRFVVAMAATLGIIVLALARRRRWPAVLVAWLAYLCILAPVSGGLHNGRHLAADRNTYLACLPWALLFGAAVAAVVQARLMGTVSRPAFRVSSTVIGVWLIVLAVLASYQTTIWRDDETLWHHALAIDPGCFACHHNLGSALARNGLYTSSIEHFQHAVALRPREPSPHGGLVFAYLATGARDRAASELQALGALDPGLARDLSPAFLAAW
jgi:hypothetical protein